MEKESTSLLTQAWVTTEDKLKRACWWQKKNEEINRKRQDGKEIYHIWWCSFKCFITLSEWQISNRITSAEQQTSFQNNPPSVFAQFWGARWNTAYQVQSCPDWTVDWMVIAILTAAVMNGSAWAPSPASEECFCCLYLYLGSFCASAMWPQLSEKVRGFPRGLVLTKQHSRHGEIDSQVQLQAKPSSTTTIFWPKTRDTGLNLVPDTPPLAALQTTPAWAGNLQGKQQNYIICEKAGREFSKPYSWEQSCWYMRTNSPLLPKPLEWKA